MWRRERRKRARWERCLIGKNLLREESTRIEVHDLPPLCASDQFKAKLTFAAGDAASATGLVFNLEVGKDDAATVLLRGLEDVEGDAEGFIAGKVGVDLILEGQVAIHSTGVKGREQTALGVTFEAVAEGAEDLSGSALVEWDGVCGRGGLLSGEREDEGKKN